MQNMHRKRKCGDIFSGVSVRSKGGGGADTAEALMTWQTWADSTLQTERERKGRLWCVGGGGGAGGFIHLPHVREGKFSREMLTKSERKGEEWGIRGWIRASRVKEGLVARELLTWSHKNMWICEVGGGCQRVAHLFTRKRVEKSGWGVSLSFPIYQVGAGCHGVADLFPNVHEEGRGGVGGQIGVFLFPHMWSRGGLPESCLPREKGGGSFYVSHMWGRDWGCQRVADLFLQGKEEGRVGGGLSSFPTCEVGAGYRVADLFPQGKEEWWGGERMLSPFPTCEGGSLLA